MSDKSFKHFFEVLIIGGGPAGLSAALLLARCRRKILVFDSGTYRNQVSNHLNGFLTRDGIKPSEFLESARRDLEKYEVSLVQCKVNTIAKKHDVFEITCENGDSYSGKKVLLATGIQDEIPGIPGVRDFYGKSIFHCPYCDGYEVRDKVIGVIGKTNQAGGLALSLKTWSDKVILFLNGRKIRNSVFQDTLQRN